MRRAYADQISEADTFDATSADLEPQDVFVSDPWAEALCACFDYMRNRNTRGARPLYEAVNDAFVTLGRL